MADMSRTASAVEGFSVYQPALGSPLQFLPAVGTKELEHLIGAYLPGPGSAQEKRATISMDFFEHSRQTGENFKYYAVVTPAATPESAYNVSPVMSDLSFYSSPSQASTPAVAPAAKKPRTASQKPAKATTTTTDFSHLPGMKILTADGQDVTNSVSRGCKSKEQRDHAHLMRILKACDACKKKKVKCDPSHKKRLASQVESKSEAAKPAKKSRKTTVSSPTEHSAVFTPAPEASFQTDSLGLSSVDFSASMDESWDQFLTFNDEPVNAPIPQDFYGAVPQDFDFFFGMDNSFSPSMSGSSVSSAQPLTPVSSGLLTQANDFTFNEDNALVFLQSADNSQEPNLPYLNPAGQIGSNYVDFNLFSPTSSFIDEEPQSLKSAPASQAQSPAGLDEQLPSSTGLAHDQQSRFDRPQSQSRSTLSPSGPEQRVPGGGQAAGRANELIGSLPYHADDAGHSTARSASAVTRLQGLQTIHTHTTLGCHQAPVESLSADSGLSRQSSSVASAPVLSQGVSLREISRDTTPVHAGNGHKERSQTATTVRNPHYPFPSMAIMLTFEKENRYLDPGRRREDVPDLPDLSTTDAAQSPLASSISVIASRSGSTGSLSPQPGGISSPASSTSQGGLPSGLSLHGHAPQGLRSSANGNAASGLRQLSRVSVEGPCLSDSGSALVCQQRGLGSANVNAELPLQGLVLSQGLPQHPSPAPKPARLSPSEDSAPLSSPARQLLVAGGSSSEVLPSQLAASGLVSILLSLLMVVVVVTTLHQQRTQKQAQAQNILAGLPSIPAVFLAILSTAAPVSTASPRKRSGGILGRVRSFLSPVARVVPLLSSCC
ncbi:hypothetical protein INS49_001238 [Diaporthe citri]|uniref:uncharacterized protein n=1 Tax=Diaporthe citri TaxID=83186 RepID=UPI001C7E8E47|nr:uncharacterized protein INS49_001238 [Diaporthe citri]KAG6367056.1 hypothetical protein INS49_001238 [Diaporthe citri]